MGISCLFGHKWEGCKCTKCGKMRQEIRPHYIEEQNLYGNMVFIEGGTFTMGDVSSEGQDYEKPAHQVTLSSFYLGKYQVTREQWLEVMGYNPSSFIGYDLPVEQISWKDCVKFCNKLSDKEGMIPCYSGRGENIICDWNANGYRLPTEAEWEYAAKGGNSSKGFKYAGSNDIGSVAWYRGNSGSKTHQIGQKQANELDLHDMSGNVYEWCWDSYINNYYGTSPSSNPTGPVGRSIRVFRGGSWFSGSCRVPDRDFSHTDAKYKFLGIRLCKTASGCLNYDVDEYENLVDELLEIEHFLVDCKPNERAYEIGELLYEMGGGRVHLMLKANETIKNQWGYDYCELSECWNGIGRTGNSKGKEAWWA